jgi:hypothetical protein
VVFGGAVVARMLHKLLVEQVSFLPGARRFHLVAVSLRLRAPGAGRCPGKGQPGHALPFTEERSMECLVSASVLLSLAFAMSGEAQEKSAKDDVKVSNERVQKLFDTMREGKYNNPKFPELKWEDIPALLEMGTSKRILKNFPVNPLSSQFVMECPEGIVALWLVEGLRRGGRKFASLNALCLPEGEITEKWTEASAKNHDRVLKAYQEWWRRAQSLPAEKAAEMDPLKGTKLHWH